MNDRFHFKHVNQKQLIEWLFNMFIKDKKKSYSISLFNLANVPLSLHHVTLFFLLCIFDYRQAFCSFVVPPNFFYYVLITCWTTLSDRICCSDEVLVLFFLELFRSFLFVSLVFKHKELTCPTPSQVSYCKEIIDGHYVTCLQCYRRVMLISPYSKFLRVHNDDNQNLTCEETPDLLH